MSGDNRQAILAAIGPLAALIAAMVAVQVGSSYAKLLFPLVGAPGVTALRVGFSALVLLALFRPWKHSLDAKDAGAIALFGCALGVMNLTFYLAASRIPLGIAVAIEFLGPLSVALFSSRRAIDFVWIGLAVLGLCLLLPLTGTEALDPVGVAFGLCAGLAWALYILFGQRAGRSGGQRAVVLGMSVAALLVTPIGIAQAGTSLFTPSILAAGFVVAMLSSALPYSLEMLALQRIRREVFGVLMSLEPAIAALAGLALLDERLTVMQWFAILCVILASAGVTLSARRQGAQTPA